MMLERPTTFVLSGLLYMTLGLTCLVIPQLAAVSVALLCGGTLLVAGLLALWHWRITRGWPGTGASLFSAVALGGFGLLLLVFPVAGILTAGFLLTLFFLLDGFAKLSLAMTLRGFPGWGWFALNGAISLLLAGIVFAQWPVSATWILGLVVGVHLLLKGWATLLLGLIARPL